MARPETIRVRVSQAEHDGLEQLAECLHVSSPSEAVRVAIRKAMAEHGIALARRQPSVTLAASGSDDKV